MTRCGVDLFGFDQLLPGDGRLAALVWSWAPDEPARRGCAIQRADGWRSVRCRSHRASACEARGGYFIRAPPAEVDAPAAQVPAAAPAHGQRGRQAAGRDGRRRRQVGLAEAAHLTELEQIVAFLAAIGLPCRAETVDSDTVLPGLHTVDGELRYDPERLAHPGDLLHEAGHLALMEPAERVAATGNLGTDGGFEMGAMAWSWAALQHLGLPPEVVFHADGYRGDAEAIIANFAAGMGPGVPMLQWRGLTTSFPAMDRWLAE